METGIAEMGPMNGLKSARTGTVLKPIGNATITNFVFQMNWCAMVSEHAVMVQMSTQNSVRNGTAQKVGGNVLTNLCQLCTSLPIALNLFAVFSQ